MKKKKLIVAKVNITFLQYTLITAVVKSGICENNRRYYSTGDGRLCQYQRKSGARVLISGLYTNSRLLDTETAVMNSNF